jgi:hypothetical protein
MATSKRTLKKLAQKAKSILTKFGYSGYDNEYYEYNGYIGLKVGEFTHNCNIESTDIIILLCPILNGKEIDIKLVEDWGVFKNKII